MPDYNNTLVSRVKECGVSEATRKSWTDKLNAVLLAEEMSLLSLNIWETDFLQSVKKRIDENIDLTMQQSIALNSIYRRIK